MKQDEHTIAGNRKTPKLRNILIYAQRRLVERSTRVALVTLAGTMGISLAAEHLELVAAIVGLALVIVAPDDAGSHG